MSIENLWSEDLPWAREALTLVRMHQVQERRACQLVIFRWLENGDTTPLAGWLWMGQRFDLGARRYLAELMDPLALASTARLHVKKVSGGRGAPSFPKVVEIPATHREAFLINRLRHGRVSEVVSLLKKGDDLDRGVWRHIAYMLHPQDKSQDAVPYIFKIVRPGQKRSCSPLRVAKSWAIANKVIILKDQGLRHEEAIAEVAEILGGPVHEEQVRKAFRQRNRRFVP